MSKKVLIILLGIFIVLGIIASLPLWKSYVGFGKKSLSSTELEFSAFTKNTVDKVTIAKSGRQEEVLSKENGLWKINGFDVDPKEVDSFFKILSTLTIDLLVSKNPKNHKSFGLGDKDGFIVTLTSGNTNTTFIVGNRGTVFNSFYAKKKNSPNVYLIFGGLRDKLSQSISAWRDKTVVNIPKDSIFKINIKSKINPLVVTKANQEWRVKSLDKTATLDNTTADRLLAAFGPLEAFDFLNKKEQAEFRDAKDKTIVQIFSKTGEKSAEIALLKKNTEWWAQVSGKSVFYKISNYKIDNILLQPSKIFK